MVIILTDDLGYADIGCYGAEGYSTPHLDQLAAEGVKLTSFYAAQSVCSASRAGLLTGCYPNRIGIHGAFIPGSPSGINPDEETLAELLQQNGYKTAIYGKWHLGDQQPFLPLNHGFDEYLGIPYSNDMWPNHPWQGTVFNFPPLPLIEGHEVIDTLEDQTLLTQQLTEKSINFIQNNKHNPFFLYLAHPQPHVPLFAAPQYQNTTERGRYGDVITELDASVGAVMQALTDHGLSENTLLIFTSDNGPWLAYGDHAGSAVPFREGKQTNWEGGVRVPGIIRFPGRLGAGRSINTPLMNIDLLPTIARLVGAELPQQKIDGKDVWPILTGETTKSPHEAYYFYFRTNELQAIRSGDWKLVFPHAYVSLDGAEGGSDGLPAQTTQLEVRTPELYHMQTDSTESRNVANQYPEVVARLTTLADKKRAELGDALTGVDGTENRPVGMLQE